MSQELAELRVEAMRPSLEAVGRFDPERARERFLNSFAPEDTTVIHLDQHIIGFYVVRRRSDHLYLDHLYVSADFQGQGIGRTIINTLKDAAREQSLPIRLKALNGSPANVFYQGCGFKFISSDPLDSVYEWRPDDTIGGS